MLVQDGAEYPSVPKPSNRGVWIEPAALRDALQRVTPWISPDNTRPHLHGAHLENRGDVLLVEATNGHGLARVSVPGLALDLHGDGIIIPLRAVEILTKGVLASEKVRIESSKGRLFVYRPGLCVSVVLLDAKFPPADQVIPQVDALPTSIRVDREIFAATIRGVSCAGQVEFGRPVSMQIEEARMALTAASPEGVESEDVLEIASDRCAPLKISVSSVLMLNALSAVGGEEIRASFGGDIDPIRIDGGDTLAIVMPRR